MKKEQLAFLLGGFAFGILVGWGLFNAMSDQPGAAVEAAGVPRPAGPAAPTQVAGGDAPVMAEVNALKAKLQETPGDVSSLLRLGDLYRQGAMWTEAYEYYDRASQAASDRFDLQRGLANLFHDAGRCDEAAVFYGRALELNAAADDVLVDLGICYRQLGRLDEALASFESARRVDGDNWEAMFNYVVVAGIDLGRLDDARRVLGELAEMKPDSADVARLQEALNRAAGAARP